MEYHSPLRLAQLNKDYAVARVSPIMYWIERKFRWSPKGFYQTLLLGCFDQAYIKPDEDWVPADQRGKPYQKFAWRVGRQSGKTESLALGALYLGFCKPIYYKEKERFKDKESVTDTDNGWRTIEHDAVRGAKIIVASADADKAKTISDRVMKFLDESEEMQAYIAAGVIKIKKHPFVEITIFGGWKHPAVITFRGPGANGQALRSKTYDYKLYDEADYFPLAFWTAEKATIINAGETGLTILSSTPTGRRENFYRACFTADAPVVMADRTTKPISQVKIGDIVLNRYGTPERVTDIMSRPYSQNLHTVVTSLNKIPVTATTTHRFMAIKKSDRFCSYCFSTIWNKNTDCLGGGNHRKHFRKPPQPEYYKITTLDVGDYLAIPDNFTDENPPLSVRIDGFLMVPITAKIIDSKDTEVYNLTVGEDHSYCVNGYGVANCTDVSLGYKEFWFTSHENPNYTPQLDREFTQELSNTAYVHEIMADWGTVDNGVFDWTFFEWVFRAKNDDGTLRYSKLSKTPNYRNRDYVCLRLGPDELRVIGDRNFAAHIHKRLPNRKSFCKYWFGADLGFSNDPSEFVVFEEFNGVMKLILRLHLEHLEYDVQADIIALLDTFYKFELLGMDRGNAGSMMDQTLKSKRDGWNRFTPHNFDKRLISIQFGERVPVDRRSGKEITMPAKPAMTNMIIYHGERKLLILPPSDVDPEIEQQFRNHTYTTNAHNEIVYNKVAKQVGEAAPMVKDHIIDAVRTCFYAKHFANFSGKARSWAVGGTFNARAY